MVEVVCVVGFCEVVFIGDCVCIEKIVDYEGIDLLNYEIVYEVVLVKVVVSVVVYVWGGEVAFVMKGLLDMFIVFKVVFNKEMGFYVGCFVSYVGVVQLLYYYKFFLVMDVAINIVLILSEKIDIIRNVVDCVFVFGVDILKVALLVVVEKVNLEKMFCIVDVVILI